MPRQEEGRLSRSERRAEREAHQKQIEQRYRKQRQRNVAAIPGVHTLALVLDNLKAGFNVPKIFRSAQAFGAAQVHLVDIGVFDPAPAKGAFRKVPAKFHETYDQAHADLLEQGYTIYALAPNAEKKLTETVLAEKSAFVIGHEEVGLSFDVTDFVEIKSLSIPHFSEMESLNASVAASIVMYEYIKQHGKEPS